MSREKDKIEGKVFSQPYLMNNKGEARENMEEARKIRISNGDLVRLGFPNIIIRRDYQWVGRSKRYIDMYLNGFKRALQELVKKGGEGEVILKGGRVYLITGGRRYMIFQLEAGKKKVYKRQNLKIVKEYIRRHVPKILEEAQIDYSLFYFD